MKVEERIGFFRKQKGYTVNKLARLSGISQSYLRDIELGKKHPTVEILASICGALDLTLKDFFTDDAASSISSDPLIAAVYRLTPAQKNALRSFLDTMRA